MFRRKLIAIIAIVTILVTGFATTGSKVNAAAFVTTLDALSISCSSVTFTFTTNASKVTFVHAGVYTEGFTLLTDNDYPISGAGTYTITMNFAEQEGGSTLGIFAHFDESPYHTIINGYYECGAAASAFAGPAVPEGWTQHWMACSSAVFDAPGGNPIGDDAVWAGQSFYVNPEPQLDASGKSWSQVFVSSVVSPWIPTSCVK